MNYNEKLGHFAAVLEKAQMDRLKVDGVDCFANRQTNYTRIIDGKKYSKVDIGNSGRYMVDKQTEEIFGVKGYGVIHRGHRFGTLDTIQNWNWGGYYATPI